ncbi:MAG: response regulator [Candidatus Omnitrophota bacterium]
MTSLWQRFFGGKKAEKSLLSGKRILTIEDSEIDRKIILKSLERKNCYVSIAFNGEEGIERALKEKPDLIILDCGLPGISGPEVCKRIKRNETTKDIPVVFLTSKDSPENIVSCYDLGAEIYLMKPISPKLLIKQIEAVLKEKGMSGGEGR